MHRHHPPILAWSEKEGTPSLLGSPLHLCSQTHSFQYRKTSHMLFLSATPASWGCSQFSNKVCQELLGTYSKNIASLLWEYICMENQVFAMLEGLTLGRVFSLKQPWKQAKLLLPGRHWCLWLWATVSPFVILHSDSQWGNFCFGGHREVAGGKNTPCLLPRGNYDQLTSRSVLLDSQGVENRDFRRGSRVWAKPL